MELSPGSNGNDDVSKVNNNNRRQNVNNGGPEGLETRVRRMRFTPFVTSDHNAISIVNAYTPIDLSKLLQGPTEHYNEINIPMDAIMGKASSNETSW